MPIVHRTLDGDWAECSDITCKLKFHIPNTTVEETKSLPLTALLPLLNTIDPPDMSTYDGRSIWMSGHQVHRDYDLPAIIRDNGEQEWVCQGKTHRAIGRPAHIFADGTQLYARHNFITDEQGQRLY